MLYFYITSLTNPKIEETLKKPIEIKENLFITNNPAHTSNYISTDKLLTIGTLEAKHLTRDFPVIYSLKYENDIKDTHLTVVDHLKETNQFLMSIWLSKDNSSNCEMCYAFSQNTMHTHSNFLSNIYTGANGKRNSITLPVEQLKKICLNHKNHLVIVKEKERIKETNFRKTIHRTDRGWLYLSQARSSEDLAQKIANYCSCFEALFSTSSAELSHQLSERIAFFLFENPKERLEIYKKLKKCYSIRSKTVHGDYLSEETIKNLANYSVFCDEITRKIFNKILFTEGLEEVFQNPNNQYIEDYMVNLIFGI